MVFKPFKPPLIRKNTQDSNIKSDLPINTLDNHGPPAKRPRLHQDRTVTNSASLSTRTGRKPLVQVSNIGEPGGGNIKDDEPTEERYFNVLWRKPTTKKNKTWDGDGIISVRNGHAHLWDVSGKDMGRAMHASHIEPGVMLSIGGKEVEVDSEMSKKEYLSGRQFLQAKPSPTPPVAPLKKGFVPVLGNKPSALIAQENKREKGQMQIIPNPASRKPSSISSAYKRPLLETTVIPQKSAEEPVPRHDPKQPGALVMKRPASAPKGKRIVDVVIDPILAKHLRPHQREGVKFLYECVMGMRPFNGQGAILADDMGLGKTLQTITLLWTLLKQNPIYEDSPAVKKALIVCPVTLINNWRKEFRKWLGNERIGVFVFDDKRKRLTDFTRGRAYNIMIVGYEKLRTVQEGLAQGAGVDIIIADEGHRLKTLQNKSGQAIQSLNATKRVILSGTPIQNDLKEFFAAVDLVNPGVLGTFKAFVREFEGPIVKSRQPEATRKDIEKGEARNEELRELTSQFMLRRTADILADYLPPKSEYVLFCDPTPTQANIYQNVLASPVFQCAVGNSENALQLITILKKLCNSPSLLSPRSVDETPSETIAALLSSLPPNLLRHFSPSSSAKIRVLDQLLHILHTSTSEKVVLVSNYTSTLNLLATLLTSLSLPFLRLDGSTPAQKRQSLVEDFNRFPANRCFAFLLSAKAGGTGLNLIGASRLILFDVDWNPATDIQAMARIHRDGQKRHCRIYRVLLKGSLEEKIWQRQVTKLGLADSVMEHKDSAAQFSRDELKDLFRLDQDSKCQTHELLGCNCEGRGQDVLTPDSDAQRAADGQGNVSDSNDSEEVEEDFPDPLAIIQASKLDMEKQERMIKANCATRPGRRTTKSPDGTRSDKQKHKMQQSLSQYSHIDPSHLKTATDTQDIQQAIDDDVLLSMLTDEDNRISFVFKKSSVALAKNTDSSMPII
ncbi:SNF2 family N-terminal domain-containing protein [Aspergillus bertholletiae]|uniref:SNF2 family N-terminal domain-containing protein n=1 Tax=Aspergillus bertholletiae TaxID=1226010 RepID=A0A5N7BFW0_9EURO|nr:SNF2 family N-terminal domain-containing protein [Aspergillus bertholletiae]